MKEVTQLLALYHPYVLEVIFNLFSSLEVEKLSMKIFLKVFQQLMDSVVQF